MSTIATLDVLVLSDTHYVCAASDGAAAPWRDARLGQVLMRKALLRLQHLGVRPQLIVLLGDLVDDGAKGGARADWQALAGEARKTGIPLLAVPGNHDGDEQAAFARVFGCEPGIHEIGDYVFLLFHDQRVAGERFRRAEEALTLPRRAAARYPGRPLIALQHHPHHPTIDDPYPYHLENRDAVMAAYRDAGVCLSLSGHFHAGQAAHAVEDVVYATAPALCEAPYRFLHVRLEGRQARVQEHALRLDAPGLTDVHCHTEMAYCATNVTVADDIRLAQALGVETLCIVEHAFQLYFPKDDAWSFRWQSNPGMIRAAWATPGRGRMLSYWALANGFRDPPRVRMGLEVDLCGDGKLLLAPEDRDGWDILVGAIHEIPGFKKGVTSQEEAESLFLRDVARLLAQPIDVLAHPFRFFARKGLTKPAHLYPAVADMLAKAGVAAEINFHTNEPEAAFFRACAARGARIALGSDAHEVAEIGEFAPHLRALEAAGVARADFPRALFTLGAPRAAVGVVRGTFTVQHPF